MSKPEKGVYIAIPNYRQTVVTTLAGWLFSLSPPPDETFFLDAVVMQPVDACRNKIVHQFLQQSKLEWLLMIDDDIVPWPKLLDMRFKGKLIISGLTYIIKHGMPVVCGVTEHWKDMARFGGIKEGPNDPVEVEAVGAGALMIHRSVLEKIKPPWFRFTYKWDGERKRGEDFYFSDKAVKAGYSLWLDPASPCGHIHMLDIREQAVLVSAALDASSVKEFTDKLGLIDPRKPKNKKKG